MIKKIFVALSVALLILTACNPSLEKVSSQANRHDSNYSSNTLVPLTVIYAPSSIDKIGLKWEDVGLTYKADVYSSSLNMMNFDLRQNSFRQNKSDFNGYVRCDLVGRKEKLKVWGIAPAIVTCLYWTLLGGPFGHCTFERDFKFDIINAEGDIVKTYYIKGKKNNSHSLYSANNYDGTDLAAFKDALKKLEKQLAEDSNELNASLIASSNEIRRQIERPFTDRDLLLAEWLNSGVYPSVWEMNQAIADAPDDYVAWGLRAMYNYENEKYTAALVDLDKYCSLNPTCKILRPHFYRAEILYSFNRKDEALEALQLAKAYYGEDENFLLLEGAIFSDCGALEPALKSMQTAVAINSDNLSAIQCIANLKQGIEDMRAEKRRQKQEEQMRRAMAIAQVSNAMTNISNSLTQINNSQYSTVQTNTRTNGVTTNQTSIVKTKDCSMCHGKGWIAGTSGVSFSSSHSYYCDECHREVPSSHSHDQCPSCRGKCQITTLN